MTDLESRIRERLGATPHAYRAGHLAVQRAEALRAVLDIHRIDEFWSRPGREESCEGCGVEDAICGDPTPWPCDTVKAIALALGVSDD